MLRSFTFKTIIVIGVLIVVIAFGLGEFIHHNSATVSANDSALTSKSGIRKIYHYISDNKNWYVPCVLYFRASREKRAELEKNNPEETKLCIRDSEVVFHAMKKKGIITDGSLSEFQSQHFWNTFSKVLSDRTVQ